MMMNLEQELKTAFQRERPPSGFAARVLERCSEPPVRSRSRVWRALAVAALLTAMIGGWGLRYLAERRAGQRARDEVLLALRITSDKLQDARAHVNEIGSKD